MTCRSCVPERGFNHQHQVNAEPSMFMKGTQNSYHLSWNEIWKEFCLVNASITKTVTYRAEVSTSSASTVIPWNWGQFYLTDVIS